MRVRALFSRIVKQFIRDKRTLALLIVAPLLVLTLLSLVFNGKTYDPKIGLVNLPSSLQQNFEKQTEADIEKLSLSTAKQKLHDQSLDDYIFIENGQPNLTLEGSDPGVNQQVLKSIQEAMTPLQQHTSKLSIHYLHGGKNLTSFETSGQYLLVFSVFSLSF